MPPSAPLLLTLLLLLPLPLPAHADADADAASPLPLPIIIHTWSGPFKAASSAASTILRLPHASALDAIQAGASACEQNQCDGTVGPGGSPDETCETTLDALLMHGGHTLNVGAVGSLRRVKNAVAVARHVLEYTQHSLLVGDLATRFAIERGFVEEDLATGESVARCEEWKRGGCQPNARRGGGGRGGGAMVPDPGRFCGPYRRAGADDETGVLWHGSDDGDGGSGGGGGSAGVIRGHDTIALVALDAAGDMAAGTSTNGQAHKIPGRVGDAPIPGSGAYVDSLVGGCGATGDGDIMMRFLPCYQAVESMRQGLSPREAAEDAVRRMLARYPGVRAGLVVMNRRGEHAGAASNWAFSYSFRTASMNETGVVDVPPMGGAAMVRGFDGMGDEL
ncbi:probable glycosylasparaginase [Claviceps purpurea 20.1]|uniref:Probable glycosylasparaginase n=1 Tax=Claviceps purpurea (strain 20.1) TaxID=1111077 RepID=M1VWU4_CLAP2|nr:probable glycosylasparaginase [Claviceps purpurea 20.1]